MQAVPAGSHGNSISESCSEEGQFIPWTAPDSYKMPLLPEWARVIQESISGYELTRTQVWPGRRSVCALRTTSSTDGVYLVITDDEREMRAALGLPAEDHMS